MNAPAPDALAVCLLLSRACARLELSMADKLGDFHGLDFADFSLLHRLASAPDGRVYMADLADTLGLKLSSLMRKLVQLEKVGLAQRDSGLSEDGSRCASLRPAGKRLLQEAEVTVRAVCAQALGRVPLAYQPEIGLALVALCHDEALECAER
ncbi:MAG: MarR family winged helix-turn-helix transcriptional regulator [Giesbergeria sp.]